MRLALLYDPLLLLERIGQWANDRRRLRRLRATPAAGLAIGHIDSLELLELLGPAPPRVIYDVGANVGTWTRLAKSVFPLAEMHVFEPLDVHLPQLQDVARSLPNVTLHRVALGPDDGEAVMKVLGYSDASSMLPITDLARRRWQLTEKAAQTVQVRSLDGLRDARGLPVPALLKLDIQGFELEALRGAERTLRETSYVLCEVCFEQYYFGQCTFESLTAFLHGHGYEVFAMASTDRGSLLRVADVLYVRHEHALALRDALRRGT